MKLSKNRRSAWASGPILLSNVVPRRVASCRCPGCNPAHRGGWSPAKSDGVWRQACRVCLGVGTVEIAVAERYVRAKAEFEHGKLRFEEHSARKLPW